jgi:hypothetical protein
MVVDRDWNRSRSNTARTVSSVVRAALCAALLGVTACAPTPHGSFTANNYTSDYGYDISYQQGTQHMLPPTWNIDNYRLDGARWVRKDQRNYVAEYEFDDDGDGNTDHKFHTFTYDLRYVHRVHSGVIWLRNIPISGRLRSKDLHVLMQDYIDQMTPTTYEIVQLTSKTSQIVVVEHRDAAVIVEQGPAIVAGQAAYAATIDVANVDQVKLSPGARLRRIQLVLMRAPKDERIEPDEKSAVVKPAVVYPVVILAGYSNMPMDFQVGLDDFHDFLRRLSIGGKSGLTLHTAPSEPPAAPSPPPVAPQPITATVPPASP